jgi:uncharacterized protein
MIGLPVRPKKRPTRVRSAESNGAADVQLHHASASMLTKALQEVHGIIPPLWQLRDYVAVNPYLGLSDTPFLTAGIRLQSLRHCEFLMPRECYTARYTTGQFSNADLEAALRHCRSEYPDWYDGVTVTGIVTWLKTDKPVADAEETVGHTIAQQIDRRLGSLWSGHVVNDITRHCAAHYDLGQAAWHNPWRSATLYEAWLEASRISRRMDLLGLHGFRSLVRSLPADSRGAILCLLRRLGIPESAWKSSLLRQAFSVAGWASYLKNTASGVDADSQKDSLQDLLAMRLAYDVALFEAFKDRCELVAATEEDSAEPHPPDFSLLARYLLQVASEEAYRGKLLERLATHVPAPSKLGRKRVQLVFCIDVRSEVMRRHLESLDSSIETFGFAGFFGAALDYCAMEGTSPVPQCPVLLTPNLQVAEQADLPDDEYATRQKVNDLSKQIMGILKGSASSGFSFVETLGMANVGRLFSRTLGLDPRKSSPKPRSTLKLRMTSERFSARDAEDLLFEKEVSLAESILRNLGLTSDFAPLVVLCGHASEVTNNPYRASLACGACGGHSGEPNARFVARLLNDWGVRGGLKSRGIIIPADCQFVAAVHETCSDTVSFRDVESVPSSHRDEIEQIRRWLAEAGSLCRHERASALAGSMPEELLRRGSDWAQVRPEWGLAGNAAFIVASRSRTVGLDLGGRTFLHSYDRCLDPELKTLELILTAPMIVTSWINLQYYASTVDPHVYGSGNKTIHNVVGRFGVLEGNGGDLMTGLPSQSVHDGREFRHEPLRLSVIVDASREDLEKLIRKHPGVRQLLTNGWVSLLAWEGASFFRWSAEECWETCESVTGSSIH